MDVGEDRISNLPDPLLHHIFSFLPTKCVVSTTILSKRWKNVWVYIPVLNFRNMGPPRIILTKSGYYDKQAIILETNKFMDFVDRVLITRNMLSIKKFCLNCESEYFDHKRVNAWITMAVKCEVEDFAFYGCYSYPRNGKMIPDSLFTCESLTTLDFQFPERNWQLELPESISLPRLKILRLTNIIYDDEKLAGKLFSSCPGLEELCLTNCRWENFDFIRFSAPALKFFTLTGGGSSGMEYSKIKIDAPNLMSFTFCDRLPEDFVVDSFPLLHDADICFEGDIENTSGPLSKFIEKFCNVKLLKISGAYFQILKRPELLSTSFPTFGNLIRLEVYDIQIKTLLNFLELSPNLEFLVIDRVNFTGNHRENISTFKVVPHCLVACLKLIEIPKFTGYLEMVKFVLKHGRVLQTVIIDDYKTEAKRVEASTKSLMTILRRTPWASPGCVIKFLSKHRTCCEFRL
ncbi:hypothetical protein MKX03_006468 [Papaver bracteatum]|nr:hypothetical protein MKX03_006468 [Papaver bracteatum]